MSLTVDASDNAEGFFAKRGYVAKQRNTVTVNGEWLANTTMQKYRRRPTVYHCTGYLKRRSSQPTMIVLQMAYLTGGLQ